MGDLGFDGGLVDAGADEWTVRVVVFDEGVYTPGSGGTPTASGRLRVTTSPAVASTIIVDGMPRSQWGLDWLSIPQGSHEVCFTDIPGFTKPACSTVTTAVGWTTTAIGTFTERGHIRAVTDPVVPATIAIDGVDRNDWGVYTEVAPGSHRVCWRWMPGTATPECTTVTVTAGDTTTATGTYTPITSVLSNVTHTANGFASTCAIANAKAWCWGNFEAPHQLPLTNVTEIVSKTYTTCAIADAKAWCWGRNEYGQVGNGTSGGPVSSPYELPLTNVTDIVVEQHHTCAIADGEAWCWGRNDSGQVGNGTKTPAVTTPQKVVLQGVTDIAVGYATTCALTGTTAWCWGANSFGQAGALPTIPAITTPHYINLPGVTAISVGNGATCAVADNKGWCWGRNDHGQMGNGTTGGNYSSPQHLPLTDVTAIVVGGDWTTCAIAGGRAWCWGDTTYGLVGNGTSGQGNTLVVPTPYRLPMTDVTDIEVSYFNVCAIADGRGWCWGQNGVGQIGNGESGHGLLVTEPFRLPLTDVTMIDIGGATTCAVAQNREWCWGSNERGQLGTGTSGGWMTNPYGPI